MKSKILLGIVLLLPLVFQYYISNGKQDLYYKYSLERMELCLKHAKELNVPTSICSDITYAADASFSSSISFNNQIVYLLWVMLFVMAFGLFNLSKRLDKFEKKTDV